MKMQTIAGLLKEAEDKPTVPEDAPTIRSAGRTGRQLDRALAMFKQGLADDELIKSEFNTLKDLNHAADKAHDALVHQPMLDISHDEREGLEWWDDLYWISSPALHTLNSAEKKLKALSKKGAEPDNPYVAAFQAIIDEMKPFAAAQKYLKTKIVKKKRDKIEKETKAKETKSRQLANADVQRIRTVLTQITQQLHDGVVKGNVDLLQQQIDRWAKQYDINNHRVTSNYVVNARNPFARDIVRKVQVQKPSPRDPEELLPPPERDKIVYKEAESMADRVLERFISKNTAKLAEILTNKSNLQQVKLMNARTGSGVVEGLMRLTFADDSAFEVNNKVVWSVSRLGKYFARFPTTFHNVKLPNGRKLSGTPSEARMKKEFNND